MKAVAVKMGEMEPDESDANEESEYGDMGEMEVKCMFDDIMRAEEIKKDPKKMEAVKKYAAKQKSNIDSIVSNAPDSKIKSVDDLRKARAERPTAEA